MTSGEARPTSGIQAAMLGSLLCIFALSAIEPRDRFTWFLEVAPAVVGIGTVIALHRRFPFTPLAHACIWIHAVILLVGGHYTYAEVPLFNWIRDSFGLERNHFDRVGHFAQGFCPAILAREILLRTSPLRPGKWLFTLVSATCLSISAIYEFIEWWVSLLTGSKGDSFLGTQGDIWDTQWDMFLALCGAIVSLWFLARVHDRQIEKLTAPRAPHSHGDRNASTSS